MIETTYLNKKIAVITLSKPEKLNAMDYDFWYDLPKVIDELEANNKLKVVILKGEGRAFSAGLDLVSFLGRIQKEVKGKTKEEKSDYLYSLILDMQKGFNKIAQSKKIYIASVQGHCLGAGLDMISACDLRLASKDAIFSIRETKVGIVDDLGAIHHLPRIIGEGNTKLLALTGRDFLAEEAWRMGLINQLVEKEALEQETEALAKEVASNKGAVLSGVKEVMLHHLTATTEESLKRAAKLNAELLKI